MDYSYHIIEGSLKYYFFKRVVYKISGRQIFQADNDFLACVTFLLKIDISVEKGQERYTKDMYKLYFGVNCMVHVPMYC